MANLSNINNKLIVTDGGNLLVNKTAANNAAVGVQLMSTGDVNGTVSGDTVARFNRLSDDGEIIRFQQDTSTDGAINSLSGRIAIGSGTTGIFFDSIRDVVTPHNMTTNAYSTNISLGRDLIRFKDLYLSGIANIAGSVTVADDIITTGGSKSVKYFRRWYMDANNDFGINNNAGTSTLFYMNSSGNVGIGLTTPTGNLSMNSQIYLGATPPSTYTTNTTATRYQSFFNSGFAVTTDGLGPYPRYFDMVATGSPDGYNGGSNIRFFTTGIVAATGAQQRMVITSRGRVGIGTTSPLYRLHVEGSADERLLVTTTGGQSAGLFMRSLSGGTQVGTGTVATQNNGDMDFYTGTTSEAKHMSILANGHIYALGLGGSGTAGSDVRYSTATGRIYYQTSSKRYKTDIVNLENSLDKINTLRPVRYKDINTGEPACGLIAEETVKVIPEVVFNKEIEGFDEPQIEGINYTDLVPFLIKSIQELKAEIELLKSK